MIMWISMSLVVLPTHATRRAGLVCLGSWGFLGDAHAKRFCNTYFYYHIHVLLVKTNRMIYICCIKYRGTTCMLAVGDDKLGIRGRQQRCVVLPREGHVQEDHCNHVDGH